LLDDLDWEWPDAFKMFDEEPTREPGRDDLEPVRLKAEEWLLEDLGRE
jgi:hypothetical protein